MEDEYKVAGVWRWGIAIPRLGETIRVVCDKCGKPEAKAFRHDRNGVYGKHDACGWGYYLPITPEWQATWAELNPPPPPVFKESV